jgi:hypothetical protein
MAVILKKTGEAAALEVARKLVRLVGEEAYPIADGVSKHVTISMGVSTYPTHGKSMDEMVEFSDAGLYRAKENGRNQVGAQYDSPEDVARKAAEKSTEAHKPAEPAPAAEHATETVTSAPATAPEESPAPAVAENTIVILPPGSTASQSLFNPPMDSSGRK